MSKIKGGYILIAQKTLESEIMEKPPLYFKLWVWMLIKTRFKSNWKYQAGSFETSIKEMQKAMTFYVGNRREKPSISQIRTVYEFLANSNMILVTNRTRGLTITICNYKEYQDYNNYESHAESHAESHTQKKPQKLPQSSVSEIHPEPHRKKEVKPLSSKDIEQSDNLRIADPIAPLYNNNIHQYSSSIVYYSNNYIRDFPCENDELDFERDRRIFFNSLPGVKTFQTFDDTPKKNKKLITVSHSKPDCVTGELLRSLEKGNSLGAGIYVCVNETNGKGRKSTDVVKVRAVFADLDGSPLDPVWEYNPSMVVESSPGKFHAYWLVEDGDVPLDAFRALQEAIAVKFNSDPVVKDLPRVMRVPGFYHKKSEPFLTRVIHYTGQTHEFGYLVSLFPPLPVKQWSGEKWQRQTQNSNGEFKGQYGSSKGNRNCDLAKIVGGMLKNNRDWTYIEQECFKHNSYSHPPLPEKEVQAVLKSCRRYA